MPSDDDLFINDDLKNSAENRLNHVLFGLFLHEEYRSTVLRELGAAEDSVIYKPIDRPWGRPDFAVESGDQIVGYIEVELDKDEPQLARYRENAGVPVYSFERVEREGDRRTIGLKKLVEIGNNAARKDPAPQLKLMVRHFAKQVKGSEGNRKTSPPGPVQAQLDTRLGKALLKAGMINWGQEPVRPGKVFGRTNRENGFSVRVFSQKANDKTVSVFHITAGREEVRFSSYRHLEDYLPNKRVDLDWWSDFLYQRFDADIRTIGSRSSCPIKRPLVEDDVDDMLKAMRPLW